MGNIQIIGIDDRKKTKEEYLEMLQQVSEKIKEDKKQSK